jgi:uracil-DNA glycosylase
MAEQRPGAAAWVPDRLSLKSLREGVQECRGCELYRDATQGVMGEGRRDAALMLLGEQPGDLEDQQGEPFVGPAGRVLDDALADVGIDPKDVFKTSRRAAPTSQPAARGSTPSCAWCGRPAS